MDIHIVGLSSSPFVLYKDFVLCEDCMTFSTRMWGLYFSIEKDFSLFKWMHNDFMYVRFSGMKNTQTWSKSTI